MAIETKNTVDDSVVNEPTGDAEKGATLGGIGGALTGAVAGSAVGPVGTVIGAVIGGVAGAVGSGAAVAAVDRVDDDSTVSGIGHGTGRAIDNSLHTPVVDNGVPGVQTGGRDVDGAPDSRGIMEKTADAVTGDKYDDKRGAPVAGGTAYARQDVNNALHTPVVDNGIPGVQTGGRDIDGTPDERGILEKTADAVTGNRVDDKTGKPVAP